MEPIILLYDNAVIYSPNILFIFFLLLFSLILLSIVNAPPFFVKSLRYIIEAKKRREKTKNKRIKLVIKVVSNTYMILDKKKMRIILYLKRIVKKIEKEVLVEDRE